MNVSSEMRMLAKMVDKFRIIRDVDFKFAPGDHASPLRPVPANECEATAFLESLALREVSRDVRDDEVDKLDREVRDGHDGVLEGL